MRAIWAWIESYIGGNFQRNMAFVGLCLGVPSYVFLLGMSYHWPWWLAAAIAVGFAVAALFFCQWSVFDTLNPKHWVAYHPRRTVKFKPTKKEEAPDFDAMEQWCRENIKGRWYRRHTWFMFSRDKDAVYFKLRWYG